MKKLLIVMYAITLFYKEYRMKYKTSKHLEQTSCKGKRHVMSGWKRMALLYYIYSSVSSSFMLENVTAT